MFIPKLVRELEVQMTSASVRQPTLDDVFLKMTGREIRDTEASDSERLKESSPWPSSLLRFSRR
jgi:ABC-2 type transport system ATP-binding protein